MIDITPPQFADKILTWFSQHGRHDLPWQYPATPYRIWISEIMLQQTQVKTVIPYFLRFMKHFPNVASLAQASQDQVLHLWSGLGYYARARNLHSAAQILVQHHAGIFPGNLTDLQSLPGIGRSTAGAILSLAYGQRAAILDGNVKRVLCRFAAIEGWPGNTATSKQLWSLSETYTPQKNVASYTQAMMDLGATICRRSQAQCTKCPLMTDCKAHQQQRVAELPHKKLPKKLTIRTTHMLLMVDSNHQLLLIKRPNYGIWGGLWSLPEYNHEDFRRQCEQEFSCHIEQTTRLANLQHSFSHFRLQIIPWLVSITVNSHKIMESDRQLWHNLQHEFSYGLAKPIKQLLERLRHEATSLLPKTTKASRRFN